MPAVTQKAQQYGLPLQSAAAVTPNDSTTIDVTRALNVAVAGNVKVTMSDGTDITWYLVAGVLHPLSVNRVWSTGTTATGIVAGY
jgi:hypothetical protein